MNGGRIWLLIGGIAAVAVVALGWLLGAAPLLKQAEASDAQRVDVETTNQQLTLTLGKMKKLDDRKTELFAERAELRETIPAVLDAESYLDWVADAAALSAVSLPSISLGEAQLISVADGAIAELSKGLAEKLYVVPVSITFGGEVEQMNTFVQTLQSDGRLQLVDELVLNWGTGLDGKLSGYVFVVSDPDGGLIANGSASADGESPGDGGAAEGDEGAEAPQQSATPTPPAEARG